MGIMISIDTKEISRREVERIVFKMAKSLYGEYGEQLRFAILESELRKNILKETSGGFLDEEDGGLEMKKDLAWLKEEVKNCIEPYDEGDWLSYKAGTTDVAELILGYIDQVEQPETLSQEWIDECSYNIEEYWHVADMMDGPQYAVSVENLQNLLVPKQEITEEQALEVLSKLYDIPNEIYIRNAMRVVANHVGDDVTIRELKEKFAKPVIPRFVAEWIEEVKPDNSLRVAFEYIAQQKRDNHDDELAFWVEEGNSETFARAWLDGYTVEEEPKYYARIKGWELFVDFVGAKYWGVVSNSGRLGFVSIDGAKGRTKEEWNELGINEDNADFVKVEELKE